MTPDLHRIATRSPCRYKVAAFGFDSRGNLLGYAYNVPRISKKGGGVHAEINLLRKINVRRLASVLVIRASKTGKPSHIDICPSCARVLNKLGVKVL